MKIIAMDVMSTGVIAYYVVIASRDGLFTPILGTVKQQNYADPAPQAVILTAIVIGFSIQALMLVGVMKLAKDNPTLDSAKIEKITHHEYFNDRLDKFTLFDRLYHLFTAAIRQISGSRRHYYLSRLFSPSI
jgi:multicomponent Na+:H+ antiporter subunit C